MVWNGETQNIQQLLLSYYLFDSIYVYLLGSDVHIYKA